MKAWFRRLLAGIDSYINGPPRFSDDDLARWRQLRDADRIRAWHAQYGDAYGPH